MTALSVRKRTVMGEMPVPSYVTPKFTALRNEWYRRLEREGFEVDEPGYKSARERRRKGPALADPQRYVANNSAYAAGAITDEAIIEHANTYRFGGPRLVWDLDNAEYWRLMSAQVEALPHCYKGKAFLRRWAEIGDVRTAAADVGISRWHGRKLHERFMAVLKRKKVLQ